MEQTGKQLIEIEKWNLDNNWYINISLFNELIHIFNKQKVLPLDIQKENTEKLEDFLYCEIETDFVKKSIHKIHQLLLFNQFKVPTNVVEFDYFGKYYITTGNTLLGLEYLNCAIKLDYSRSMCALASYYHKQKDYDQMIKYYTMAIDLGDSNARFNLTYYYRYSNHIQELLDLYVSIGNYEQVMIYINGFNEKDEKLKKIVLDYLGKLPKDIIYQYGNTIVQMFYESIQEKLDFYKLHFEYSMNGKGYTDAKQDFIQRLVETNE